MTEKRYELKCHEINSWHIEKDGKVLIFDLFKSDAEILYAELNSLSNENEYLKKEKERYKRLSEIRDENINNRILTLKEFINNCEDEKVKNTLEDLFYPEVKEYDLAKENRKLKKENEQLKKEIGIDKEVVKIIKKHLPIGFVDGLVDKQIENTVKSIVEELREEEGLKKLFLNEYGDVDD